MSTSTTGEDTQAIVLVARSAIASVPLGEMAQLSGMLAATTNAGPVLFAFTEQGEPSLHDVMHRLKAQGADTVVLVPLLLPMEPNFVAFLTRTLQRWKTESPGPWPTIHVGTHGPADTQAMSIVLTELAALAATTQPLEEATNAAPDGSIVHAISHQLLVCAGGPCQAAGSAVIWGHLRNELTRLGLTVAGQGVRSARASCLGPCSLAPVVQVFPGCTYYGGVDERGIDRIINEHIGKNTVVADLAYEPASTKQRLRVVGSDAQFTKSS